jgi:hypothetical protein
MIRPDFIASSRLNKKVVWIYSGIMLVSRATNELTNLLVARHSNVALRWEREKFSLPFRNNREQKKLKRDFVIISSGYKGGAARKEDLRGITRSPQPAGDRNH